jgi:hypothetical protein
LLIAALLTATLFFTLTILMVAVLLLSALLSGGKGICPVHLDLLCVHNAFLYY